MGNVQMSPGGGDVFSDDLTAEDSNVLQGYTYMGKDTADGVGTGRIPVITPEEERVLYPGTTTPFILGKTYYTRQCTARVPANYDTYRFPSGNGSRVDLGVQNLVRYVEATNVYEKGQTDLKNDIQTFTSAVGTWANNRSIALLGGAMYAIFHDGSELRLMTSSGYTPLSSQKVNNTYVTIVWLSTAATWRLYDPSLADGAIQNFIRIF